MSIRVSVMDNTLSVYYGDMHLFTLQETDTPFSEMSETELKQYVMDNYNEEVHALIPKRTLRIRPAIITQPFTCSLCEQYTNPSPGFLVYEDNDLGRVKKRYCYTCGYIMKRDINTGKTPLYG